MHVVTKSWILSLIVAAAPGCGLFEPTAADPHAVEAVVLNHDEPPRACRYLGEVTGDVIIGDLASAHRDLVKNAADGGGNYVALDETERHPGGYGVRGRLFVCPSHIPDAPPPMVAAAPPPPMPPPPVAIAPLPRHAPKAILVAPPPAPAMEPAPAPAAKPITPVATRPAPFEKPAITPAAPPIPAPVAPPAPIHVVTDE